MFFRVGQYEEEFIQNLALLLLSSTLGYIVFCVFFVLHTDWKVNLVGRNKRMQSLKYCTVPYLIIMPLIHF